MSIHKNCFELVKEVRQGLLNEYDDALASGEETFSAYRNDTIIKHINDSIRYLFALISRRRPNEFFAESWLIAENSVLNLPGDFGKLVLLRDANGNQVFSIHQKERRLAYCSGSERVYYQKGRTLVIDREGGSGSYSLIYKSKPRDIHQGKASAGALGSITLSEKYASDLIDYYNGMTIENITRKWSGAIIDFDTSRVATVTETAAAGDFYALVPEIPEWGHHLISPHAIIMLKNLPQSKEKPGRAELALFNELLFTTLREFAGPDDDQDFEGMFTSLEPKGGGVFI